jgi:hypothetical protein
MDLTAITAAGLALGMAEAFQRLGCRPEYVRDPSARYSTDGATVISFLIATTRCGCTQGGR